MSDELPDFSNMILFGEGLPAENRRVHDSYLGLTSDHVLLTVTGPAVMRRADGTAASVAEALEIPDPNPCVIRSVN
jgi:hypothetical protein